MAFIHFRIALFKDSFIITFPVSLLKFYILKNKSIFYRILKMHVPFILHRESLNFELYQTFM